MIYCILRDLNNFWIFGPILKETVPSSYYNTIETRNSTTSIIMYKANQNLVCWIWKSISNSTFIPLSITHFYEEFHLITIVINKELVESMRLIFTKVAEFIYGTLLHNYVLQVKIILLVFFYFLPSLLLSIHSRISSVLQHFQLFYLPSLSPSLSKFLVAFA